MKKISDCFGRVSSWMKTHKTISALIVTAVFVLVQIPFLVSHEIWNDEAISWGLAEKITPSNIYELNSLEPHPLLWQIILAPFAKIGFPAAYMGVISLALIAVAVFIMIRFAPMNYAVKLIFLLSSGFFYFNPVIARPYALVPLAISVVCVAYEKRHEKPLLYGLSLALLAQTHFLMYGLIGILILGFVIEELFEKKKGLKKASSILFFIIPILLSIATTLPMVFGSFEKQPILNPVGTLLGGNIVETFGMIVETIFGEENFVFGVIIAIIMLISIIALVIDNIKISIYAIVGIFFWFFVMSFIYRGYTLLDQKMSLIVLMFIACVWMLYHEKNNTKKKNLFERILCHSEIIKYLRTKNKYFAVVIVSIMISATAPYAMVKAFRDVRDPFTNAKEVAEFINSNVEVGSLIIEGDANSYSIFNAAALVQVKREDYYIYNVVLDSYDSYDTMLSFSNDDVDKSYDFERFSDEQLQSLLDGFKDKYDHIYYVTSFPTCGGANSYNEEVLKQYEIVKTFSEEEKYIYPYAGRANVFKIK